MFLNQFKPEGNLSAEKDGRTGKDGRIIRGLSAGGQRKGRSNVLSRLIIRSVGVGVRAASATLLGTGAKRFIDDGLDRSRATAAFGATAQAAVNLFWAPRQVRSCTHGIADIVVAQDVAGTDDHETGRALRDASLLNI
jgi:hypothetical protein